MDPLILVFFIMFLVLVGAAVVVALAWLFRRDRDAGRNFDPRS